jgi:hypothetical protein
LSDFVLHVSKVCWHHQPLSPFIPPRTLSNFRWFLGAPISRNPHKPP